MTDWCRLSFLGVITLLVAWVLPFSQPAAAACKPPASAGIAVDYPQGSKVPVKLYQTNKGGQLGSVAVDAVKGRLELCSDQPGDVNEIRLPQNLTIQLKDGKSKSANGRYWVRNNQIRFQDLKSANNQKKFDCERNQVKTKSAGGAAGNEECKNK